MSSKTDWVLSFPSERAKKQFLNDLSAIIGYCTDEREHEDYNDNPHRDHVLKRGNRVYRKVFGS